MSDKKKKKTKTKQKQKQKQSQQIIVNIGGGRTVAREPRRDVTSRREEKNIITPIQPPPVVQYLYRDNLALNMLNDRTRAAQQQATTTATAGAPAPAPQATTTTVATPNTPPPATRVQPPQPPNNPSPNKVLQLIQNNKIHKSTSLTPQQEKRNVAFDFEKAINPKKTANNNDDVPAGFRNMTSPLDNVATNQSIIPTAIRMTNKGLPYRRTRDEKAAYNEYMETVVSNKPINERTKEETKAYNDYINSLGKPKADDDNQQVQQTMDTFLRPTSRKPRKIQPIDFDTVDEETDNNKDDDIFFSPLKKKPT